MEEALSWNQAAGHTFKTTKDEKQIFASKVYMESQCPNLDKPAVNFPHTNGMVPACAVLLSMAPQVPYLRHWHSLTGMTVRQAVNSSCSRTAGQQSTVDWSIHLSQRHVDTSGERWISSACETTHQTFLWILVSCKTDIQNYLICNKQTRAVQALSCSWQAWNGGECDLIVDPSDRNSCTKKPFSSTKCCLGHDCTCCMYIYN